MSARSLAKQYLADQLAAQFPARKVVRSFVPHAQLDDADLAPGRFTVIGVGVSSYPYEHSDYGPGVDAPQQTELGDMRLIITGQMKLPEGASGQDVEDAEDEMLADLEAFANAAIADNQLVTLRLLSARQSGQIDAPYGWIHTEWELPLLET